MNADQAKVYCKYGSPMGRSSCDRFDDGKVRLYRVPLNRGGYDRGGAYWGLGLPVYCVETIGGECAFLRAQNRNEAKAILQKQWGDLKFYR